MRFTTAECQRLPARVEHFSAAVYRRTTCAITNPAVGTSGLSSARMLKFISLHPAGRAPVPRARIGWMELRNHGWGSSGWHDYPSLPFGSKHTSYAANSDRNGPRLPWRRLPAQREPVAQADWTKTEREGSRRQASAEVHLHQVVRCVRRKEGPRPRGEAETAGIPRRHVSETAPEPENLIDAISAGTRSGPKVHL